MNQRPRSVRRARAHAVLPLVVALAAGACRREEALPSIVLSTVGLRVDTRDTAYVRPGPGRVQVTLRPRTRAPTQLEIVAGEPATLAGEVRTLNAQQDLRVRYSVRRSAGGSGGDEAEVDAIVEGAGRAWHVRCVAQAEFGPPEAECQRLLEHLAPAG